MTKKAKDDLIRCPECGHDVFRVTGISVDLVRFRKDGNEEGESVGSGNGDTQDPECANCDYTMESEALNDVINGEDE